MLSARGMLSSLTQPYKSSAYSCYRCGRDNARSVLYTVITQRRAKMSTSLRTTYRGLMMIKPVRFSANVETAANNVYQGTLTNVSDEEAQVMAAQEFENLVTKLRQYGIDVRVFEDTPVPRKPDAVFPNNWISFHEDNRVAVYPMYSKLRRAERRDDIVQSMVKKFGYQVVDYTHFEKESKYLEGTGSMVFDRVNKIAYSCISARTHPEVLNAFCQDFGYRPILFEASYKNVPIYHTNVLMSVAEEFAMICTDCIVDKQHVMDSLKATGKHIVNLSVEQVANFCGNALPIYDGKGGSYLAMSTRAFEALSASQVKDIEQYCKIIHSPIPIIETLGGGSVRCMLAEVF